MSDDTTPLSPRHERFVEAQPHIEAAIAVGRQRRAPALEITVERMAQECAKVAFANVDDFVEVDAEGRLRIDLAKASRAQRIRVVERTVTDHSKQWQLAKLKLGKLSQSTAVAAGNPGERRDALARCFSTFFCASAKVDDHSRPCQSGHRSGGNGHARRSTGQSAP